MYKNVIDFYKAWEHDAIVADLDSKRTDLIVAFEHVNGDFNKATGIRNLNGFLGKEAWIIGDRAKRYDKRGTVGTHHYEHVKFASNLLEMFFKIPHFTEYTVVAVENIEGATDMREYQWNRKTIMLFGEEQRGLSNDALYFADDIVYIPMRGSVRSFNVGTASGIAMYDYMNKVL